MSREEFLDALEAHGYTWVDCWIMDSDQQYHGVLFPSCVIIGGAALPFKQTLNLLIARSLSK